MTNKQYDTLKTVALILTPVLAFLASLVNIWGFPHGEQIVATLTDTRYQYVIDVYRAPLGNLSLDGWGQEQMLQHLADCINSANHTLT